MFDWITHKTKTIDGNSYQIGERTRRETPHLWSMLLGMICGIISTHIWQWVEQLF